MYEFITSLGQQNQRDSLYVSAISFWKGAFLVQKNRVAIADVHAWKNELLHNTNLHLLNPSATEMCDSTLLPLHYKDPFDRLLIAQDIKNNLILVTQDQMIANYDVQQLWL
ncbi:MAG: type II toxin-antitoxin system VapC family toxin [Caldilineaceae bacterium]